MSTPATVSCATCGAVVEGSDASPSRPFCSARCKTADLGEWASNRFVIAGSIDADGVASDISEPER